MLRPSLALALVLPFVAVAGAQADHAERSYRFMAASDARDAATLKALAHPDFRFAKPGGKRLGIDEYVALSSKRPGGPVKRSWSDESVRVAGSTAVVQATSHTAIGANASDIALTFVWLSDGAGWRLLHLQPSPAGAEGQRERWNAMLTKGDVVSDKPSQLLVDTIASLEPGRALDVGMGDGRNALALAQAGWDVTGVDIAEAGAVAAWQAAGSRGLKKFAVVLQDANAFDYGEEKWNLVALVYFPVAELAPKVQRAVKKGGVVVIEAFHAQSAGVKPTGGDVLLDLATLKKLFAGWKVLKAEEPTAIADWGKESRKLVRFVAQKP